MNVKIPESLFKLHADIFEDLGANKRDFSYRKFTNLDLAQLSAKKLRRVLEIAQAHTRIWGVGTLVADIQAWQKALAGDTGGRPRTLSQFASMLKLALKDAPGHRVYTQDPKREAWHAYYVNWIRYHPPEKSRDGYTIPAFVEIQLLYWELLQRHSAKLVFKDEQIAGGTALETLLRAGYLPETPELRAVYDAEVAKFEVLHDKVGLQLEARGVATDDMDGNDGDEGWSKYSSRTIALANGATGFSRVVVDVFREDQTEKHDRYRDTALDTYFWGKAGVPDEAGEEDWEDEEDSELPQEDKTPGRPQDKIFVPMHPHMVVFDLRRHLRLRAHVRCLTVYEYDTRMAEKLVIPPNVRELVDMLVAHRSDYQDIVAGKGGGATVLSCGPPGVGKTLTAEVYSEASRRPLYSVQCSQLGTAPDDLEGELLKVFARSERWNAILLLDEADVYIRRRGEDLAQNAIVGVFLRVLEYYAGMLFMTTNRGDTVDDAIASRCVARIDYEMPAEAEQRRIWRILADVAGIPLADEIINQAVAKYSDLSGRDIKNILKLAKMRQALPDLAGQEMSLVAIDFARRFKPTQTIDVRKEGA